MNETTDSPLELVCARVDTLGECPVWREADGCLYWIDWLDQLLRRKDLATGAEDERPLGSHCGSFAFCRSGKILLARSRDLALLDWGSGAVEPLVEVPTNPTERCFNDGKCDPAGRFWFGSLSKAGEGRLYCYDPATGEVAVRETGVRASNGLSWSPDGRTFYYTDSQRFELYAYPFDPGDGSLGPRRFVLHSPSHDRGHPDGHAMDEEGCLWIALWDGYGVIRVAPDGRLLRRVEVPAARPTSCAFGGPDRKTLYVTSAAVDAAPEAFDCGLRNGNLFAFDPGVRGAPVADCALAAR